MSNPPKIDRKSLKGPDEFMKKGVAVIAYLWRRRARFVPFILFILGVFAVVYAYGWWTSRNLEKGWKAYSEATKLSQDKRWEQLKAMYNTYGKMRPTYFAAVNLADHYFDEAKKEAMKEGGNPSVAGAFAIEWYGKALELRELLPTEKQLLRIDRGNAFEIEKRYEDAMKEFTFAVEIGGELKGLAMLSQGRILELKNEAKKAAEAYERVSVEFLNTEYARLAKNSLRRMNSPLFKQQKDL